MKPVDRSTERAEMVEHQIKQRGVRDPLVLAAMCCVPREAFVDEASQQLAYEDTPLPIAAEQTISQPYIVAFMLEALGLKGGEKVLEIGGGSGYATAVLAEFAGEVYMVERIAELAQQARQILQAMHYHHVHILQGDGTLGWAAHAPYEAIVVAAGGPRVPAALKAQLQVGGRLVIPVGRSHATQELVRVRRVSESQFTREKLADVRFVPLIGRAGWRDYEQAAAAGGPR
ncbi:MAG: protein-L-isoaspartate(D-aspartate) O-methyltransferase [Planctomycetales bacterium]|nr:protein-L-isoaspartate(D-aspartate) O-methyltransferase [Planctomycetales bacterium]